MNYCCYCGKPHPSVFAGRDDNGDEKFVHYACQDAYLKQALGPVTIAPTVQEGEPE